MPNSRARLAGEVAAQLQECLEPYYKGIALGNSHPEFRRTLTGEEIVDLLTKIHNLSVQLLKESRNV